MPLSTVDAYRDHGNPNPRQFGAEEITAAAATLESLSQVGIDYNDVVQVLEDEGVDKFAVSYRELLDGIVEQARK